MLRVCLLTLYVFCLSVEAANSDSRSDGKSKKISDEYAAKLNSMQTELKKLQAAKREHTKLLRNQSHYETQLRTLRSDLTSLKQLKVCTTVVTTTSDNTSTTIMSVNSAFYAPWDRNF